PYIIAGLCSSILIRILEHLWASRLTVPATRGGFARMGSARAWPRGGDVPFSAGAGRRGARASPSSCRPSTPLAPESRGFPRSHRLTRDAELQAVRREGKRIRTGVLEVRVLASPLRHARVGLIVPKYR